MESGNITSYFDVAQIVLYGFWLFFIGLIYYLRQEDKREGYPLESDWTERSSRVVLQGFPAMPSPKTFLLPHGGTVSAPRRETGGREILAEPREAWPGAPLQPSGDPMLDGVGPASWVQRADEPDLTFEGEAKIVPLRVAGDFSLESRDPDPRGMAVVGADGIAAGTVTDVWVDRSEVIARYYELALEDSGRRVLLPVNFASVERGRREVRVRALLSGHFATVPALRNPDTITLLEEEKICAYYAGGTLYATPDRFGPLL